MASQIEVVHPRSVKAAHHHKSPERSTIKCMRF